MRLGLSALRSVEGRKAIVAFTDGVDMGSVLATLDDNLKMVEESGVIIYPIRYNTRATVEAIVRQQQRQPAGNIPGRSPTGTTPTTVPGETRVPDAPGGGTDRSLPSIIFDRFPKDPRIPDTRSPDTRSPDTRSRYPDPRYPDQRYPDRRYPDDPNHPNTNPRIPEPGNRQPNSSDMYLDNLYRIGDDYLNQLATRSGGKLHRADSLVSLPLAFEQIAAELRTQYSLGYYPSNAARDGSYRKIQVRTNRKEVIVRAKPGYRAQGANNRVFNSEAKRMVKGRLLDSAGFNPLIIASSIQSGSYICVDGHTPSEVSIR
jgi:VWFA-related protein